MEKKICGIYCIENIQNGKKYIGQSRDIQKRFKTHKYELSRNNHSNKHLQSAWNVYGKDNFEFKIIEHCEKEELDIKEKHYIQKYNSLNNGYNMNAGGQGIPEYKHTKEEIEKMIQIQNPDPVYQCDKNLNIINQWPSASYAAKQLGFSKRQIENCCKMLYKAKTVHGFIFVFVKDWNNLKKDYYLNNHRSFPEPIFQINKDGEIIKEWDSTYQASKILGISNGEISAVCSGRRKTTHGFFWIKKENYSLNDVEKYKDKFKIQFPENKVYKYDLNFKLVAIYNSSKECYSTENFSKSTLEKKIRNQEPYLGYYYSHLILYK